MRLACDVIALIVIGLSLVCYMLAELLIFIGLYSLAELLRQSIDYLVDSFIETW